ncbi:PREDICTED: protein EPIDERMAL PATTERNING FACTOR 1-like [Nicotiana attenuata]|uniref:protein EPIDERMAL PATTERNING FACTOR 1-like n=1 Tax=Nicotiana attenuata TaxID=49451 RepID=UPI000905B540|nr:PREDICTED: protein EPIDERMAL PATTERNING FACTOR 1-like [Nicotiana attenuata]
MEYYCSVRWRIIVQKKLLLFFAISFFFLSVFAGYNTLKSTTLLEINFAFAAKADISFQKLNTGTTRRILGGLGSSPPRCMSKCGRCTPCRPVHVAVPPGTPVTTEYYPEAWRCKCGNKLYMP